TGSHPRKLTFPGAELTRISDDVFDLRSPPGRMVILGSGVVACEFGFVFARLGSQVTIVARGDRPLGGELDRDFLKAIVEHGEKAGIRWAWNTHVKAVRRDGDALAVDVGDGALAADFVLNAAGRTAAIEELDLARANVGGGEDGI